MGKKLLVADDSLTIQKVIKLALSGDVYEIQTVSDGNDALQQISVFRPDAVLIDVGIPGRSAFEVKKAMNEDSDFKYIPVILMSSAFEKVDEAKVALLQFEGRLTKPFDPTHLRQALTQALSLRESFRTTPERDKEPSLQFERSQAPEPMRERTKDIFIEEKTKTFSTLVPPVVTPKLEMPKLEMPKIEVPKIDTPIPLFSPSPFAMDPSFPKEITVPDLEDSDIKHLTESTVRMSSLDEFDSWNIGEGSKSEAPHIDLQAKPVEEDSFLTAHKMNFDFEEDGPRTEMNFNDILPPKFDHTRTGINILAPTRIDLEAPTPQSYEVRNPTPVAAAVIPGPTTEEIMEKVESLVRLQVEKSLESMAKKGLPDIAEKVIRQEIRRILESLS